jgi:signal transduction histidine kinase
MFPVVVIADRWRKRLISEAENTALANLAVLERLNKLKSEFLTRISHQFRTALVGIEGFSELIHESDDLDLDKVRSFAGDIHDDAERLDRAFAAHARARPHGDWVVGPGRGRPASTT